MEAIQTSNGLVITAAIGFLGTIATLLFNSYKDSRDRRWEREDQKRDLEIAAQLVQDKAQALSDRNAQVTLEVARQLALKTQQTADELASKNAILAEHIHMRADTLEQQMTENIAVSKQAAENATGAFNVANDLNNKVVKNQQQIQDVHNQYDGAAIGEQLDRIEGTDKDTNRVTHEIREELNNG